MANGVEYEGRWKNGIFMNGLMMDKGHVYNIKVDDKNIVALTDCEYHQ